jgi:hypothetical protein
VRSHSLTQKTQYYTTAGTDVRHDRTLMRTNDRYPKFALAPHFGYDEYDSASVNIGAGYVATHEYDRTYLETSFFTDEQREALFLHDEATLERMSRDRTVQKVYSNGGFETWLVRWTDERPAPVASEPGTDPATGTDTGTGTGTDTTTTGTGPTADDSATSSSVRVPGAVV